MKVSEVISVIEDFAPLELQEPWDNSGLCIGSVDQEVNSAVLALDCTMEVMEEAVGRGADMIITHHPLIFSGIKKLNGSSCVEKMIVYAIKNGLAVYAAHTNADKTTGGVSVVMGEKAGLVDIVPLDPGGLGILGHLPAPMDCYCFLDMLKERFGLEKIRISTPSCGKISKVAMCGGSGKSLIPLAMERNADIYVSGDIPYHEFFCPGNFMIADIGHYESELGIVEVLMSLLRKKIPNFATYISEKSYNPVSYY